MNLRKNYDSLHDADAMLADLMADAARDVMRTHYIKPNKDDDAASFEEACAVFLLLSLNDVPAPRAAA